MESPGADGTPLNPPGERALADFCRREALTADFAATARRHYWPFAAWLADHCRGRNTPLLLGINGAQGSGKSTLAELLVAWGDTLELATAHLSIDDFYLTRNERQRLARSVHPLCATRGVPGTHDLPLALAVLDRLRHAGPQARTKLPRFDKLRDDRAPRADWPEFAGRPQLILLEGWCVGAEPQADAELVAPVNRLEREADPEGHWRRWANAALRGEYPALFRQLEMLAMFQVPDMDCVYRWRRQAEQRLVPGTHATAGKAENPYMAGNLQDGSGRGHGSAENGTEPAPGTHPMGAQALEWFIMHYERLTRHQLLTLPPRADWLFTLDRDHAVAQVRRPA